MKIEGIFNIFVGNSLGDPAVVLITSGSSYNMNLMTYPVFAWSYKTNMNVVGALIVRITYLFGGENLVFIYTLRSWWHYSLLAVQLFPSYIQRKKH